MNEIQVDGDGFLVNRDDWSEEIMYRLAASDGMTLLDQHIAYIHKAREMFEQDGTVPAIRNFAKAVGIKDRKAKELYELFETGPMKRICKWGGLPKPTGCV